jgi:hypothetical protein
MQVNMPGAVLIKPRRGIPTGVAPEFRKAVVLDACRIMDLFHLPLVDACREVGLCKTAFKKVCRKLGFNKWPFRTLRASGSSTLPAARAEDFALSYALPSSTQSINEHNNAHAHVGRPPERDAVGAGRLNEIDIFLLSRCWPLPKNLVLDFVTCDTSGIIPIRQDPAKCSFSAATAKKCILNRDA